MPVLYKPGEAKELPFELNSDSSADELRGVLGLIIKAGFVSSKQKSVRGGLRVDNIITDPGSLQTAKIIAWWGTDVTALHIDSPQTEETPRVRTRFNFYTALGERATHQAQVAISEIDGGLNSERSYALEDARLGGVQAAIEWKELELSLTLLRDRVVH